MNTAWRHRRRWTPCLITLGALAVSSACRGPDPIDVWQQRLTDYIAVEGNGDPAILRDAPALRSTQSLRPAEVRFSAVNLPAAAPFGPPRDVQGVFVGPFGEPRSRQWVFIVGVNERDVRGRLHVTDIRPVALEVRDNDILWHVGPSDPAAMQRYDAALASKGLHIRRPRGADAFPRLDDVFRLEHGENRLDIREIQSGASWHLQHQPDPVGP